jgi:peroxiredoxin
MALTASQTLDTGTRIPDFDLPTANPRIDDLGGEHRSLGDYADARALVVVFFCNHCPYAIHVEDELIRIANDYAARGVQLVAISSNDAEQYPRDGFEAMQQRAREKGYPFPYLYDASQEVAKAFGAMCTPDVYVYDQDRRLAYHGRVDETRPRQQPAHGGELRQALDELLTDGEVVMEQRPAMGCNIKWKPGNQPAYYG